MFQESGVEGLTLNAAMACGSSGSASLEGQGSFLFDRALAQAQPL